MAGLGGIEGLVALGLTARIEEFIHNKKLIKPPSADFPIYSHLKFFENNEGFVPLGPLEKEFYDKQHDERKLLPIGSKFYKVVGGKLKCKYSTGLHQGLKTLNKKLESLVNCSDFGTHCIKETDSNFNKWRDICEEDKQRRLNQLQPRSRRGDSRNQVPKRLCQTFNAQDYDQKSPASKRPVTTEASIGLLNQTTKTAKRSQKARSVLRDTFNGNDTANSSGFSEQVI